MFEFARCLNSRSIPGGVVRNENAEKEAVNFDEYTLSFLVYEHVPRTKSASKPQKDTMNCPKEFVARYHTRYSLEKRYRMRSCTERWACL